MGKYSIKNEPVMATSAIVPVIVVFLQLLDAFGVKLTPEQTNAIVSVVGIVFPFLVGWYARGLVTPVSKLPSLLPEDGT